MPRRGYRLVPAVQRIEDDSSASKGGRFAKRWPLALGVLLVGTGAAALLLAGLGSPPAAPPLRIAIMPFAPPPGATAFGDPTPIADRILEELTTQVGERAGVVGPTTTASYAHADAALRQLAADYEIDYVVNGRFIDGQDGPRMLAELIRTADGAHVWVEAYRDLRDDRRIGLEIARAVRTELGLTD